MTTRTVVRSVKLTAAEDRRLVAIAKARGVTPSDILRIGLLVAEANAAQVAREAIEEIRQAAELAADAITALESQR